MRRAAKQSIRQVRAPNRVVKKEAEAPAPPPAPTKDQQLLAEIRDLLKAQR